MSRAAIEKMLDAKLEMNRKLEIDQALKLSSNRRNKRIVEINQRAAGWKIAFPSFFKDEIPF